ncbi:MAG TPA: ferritin-like domain-containing protein, partial [Pyrinomonadaceae bacterium]
MSENAKTNKPDETESGATQRSDRRKFLKFGGTGVAALALGALGAPKNALAAGESLAVVQQQAINLGTGDIAIMNYAYLLEQLEADFYTRVVANTIFPGATSEETQILTDLRDHEIIHREFFKAALGTNAIPQISFDFSLVNFNSRDSVLTHSQIFEDTGVAAYNGVGQAVQSADILTLAGKIVSVEGRHAAAIRDLRIPRLTYFAPDSEDFALDPLTVLTKVAPFVPRTVVIDASGLPRT